MTLTLQVPPKATSATFSRAMLSLGSHPDHPKDRKAFRYLPPFRKLVLSRSAAERGELAAAAPVGWQYLISDALGNAVIDLNDKIPDTFSSVRRGAFAERYEAVLKAVESDRADASDDYLAEIIELPQVGTCAVVVRESCQAWFYPVSVNGRISEQSFLSEPEFFATVPKPRRALDNEPDGDPDGPSI